MEDLAVFPALVPLHDKLMIAVYEEPDQTDIVIDMQNSAEGLEHRENAVYSKTHPNYRGWIVAVGAKSHGFAFGDEVAVRQWGGKWWNNPFRKFGISWHGHGIYPNSDKTRAVRMEKDHYLLNAEPEMVIQRFGSYEWLYPEPKPVLSRLHVRYEPRPQKNTHSSGLIIAGYGQSEVTGKIACDYNPPPLAQVLATGPNVSPDDFKAGDWVLCETGHGTLIIHHDGTECGMLESKFVPVNFGAEKPLNPVEWVSQSEAEYA